MSSTIDHYEKLLAQVYSWMVGGIENALAQGRQELEEIGVWVNRGS